MTLVRAGDRLANLAGLIDRLFCHFRRHCLSSAAICQNQNATSSDRRDQFPANGFMISILWQPEYGYVVTLVYPYLRSSVFTMQQDGAKASSEDSFDRNNIID